jgi:hypothetical protein
MKYTRDLLEEILQEGGATLLGEYERFNQRLHVRFRCKCGTEATKRFEMLNLYRCPYCEECSKKVGTDRRNQAWKEKYGVDNIFQLKEIKEKINQTCIDKYGDHPKRTKEVQEKWKATCLEKYGGHPNQNSEVQAKAEATSFKHRDYVLPSGKVVKIQGYEDRALDELLQYFTEEEIQVGRGDVPRIQYICKEGKQRIYFPDFYIIPLNTILEIKSEWTIRLETCRLDEKAAAVLGKGYKYEVWVYDSNKKNKNAMTF